MNKIAFHESKGITDAIQKSDKTESGIGPGRGLFQFEIGKDQGAHTAINRLISEYKRRKTDIKGMLKGLLQEKTIIKDAYTFGKQGRGYFKNNLLDAIINSQTRSGNNFEDLFNVALGGRFGPRNNWKAEVSGGKGRAGFNIAKLF